MREGLKLCPYRKAFEDTWALYCDHGLDLESAESVREIAMKCGLVIERPGSWDTDARIMEEWGLEDGDPIYVYKPGTCTPDTSTVELVSGLRNAARALNEALSYTQQYNILALRTNLHRELVKADEWLKGE